MGAGLRRAANAARATRGLAPLERSAVYHQATVRPFSATLEAEDLSRKEAIALARNIHKKRGGLVQVTSSTLGGTVWSLGEPGPDVDP